MRIDIDFDDGFGNNYVANVSQFEEARLFIQFLEELHYGVKPTKSVDLDLLKECEK